MDELDTVQIPGFQFPPEDRIDFTGKTYKNLATACVYVWMRNGQRLYVGFSEDGFRRLRGTHHVINKQEAVLDNDTFILFLNQDKDFEMALIRKLRPVYNKQINPRKDSLERMYASCVYEYLPPHLRKPLDLLTTEERFERREIRRKYRRGELPSQAGQYADVILKQLNEKTL